MKANWLNAALAAWAAKAALAAWLAMALFTFGHSASQPKVCPDWGDHGQRVWQACDFVRQSLIGFGAGVFWPLYWSWELQQ